MPDVFREVCLRCRRPRTVCWCHAVRPVQSQTRVVFVQHPREAKVPISTCRMAHLSLPNSELHVGLSAVGNKALEAVCRQPDVAVLFPSASATDVDALDVAPKTLIVVDGTWANAKKVVEKCPLLSALPRLKFLPSQPGNYRIRREPEAHCLATIEATAQVLERLEKAPGRFAPMLNVFDAMVEKQLDFIEGNTRASRHQNRKKRVKPKTNPLDALRGKSLVAVFGEANAWPADAAEAAGCLGEAELVQLVAYKMVSGERFERLLKPLRPVGPRVPQHLDLSAAEIELAPERRQVAEEWTQFLGVDDVLVGWGDYCLQLLADEGMAIRPFLNVRRILAQHRGGPLGSVEELAQGLGVVLPDGQGRAARRLAALTTVLRSL